MNNEELKLVRREFDWLLNDEVPTILTQLKSMIQNCINKFSAGPKTRDVGPVAVGQNLNVSLPNSDAVKGIINIAGDSVIRAELRFKFPKLPSTGVRTFVFEQCPWKLQQLQDARNHLEGGWDEIAERENCGLLTSGHQVIQLMDRVMLCLNRVKSCIVVPEKHTLSELMTLNAQRVLNPPVPEEILVSFHVNCDKLLLCVYAFNFLTAAPHHNKTTNQNAGGAEHNAIGYTFEHEGRWFEVGSKAEISCAVPWFKDIIVWINSAQQLCQQLKDKITIFQNLLPDLSLSTLGEDENVTSSSTTRGGTSTSSCSGDVGDGVR